MRAARLLLVCCLGLAGLASAQSVALTGMLGRKALVIVDGGEPKSLAAGESYRGVKIISTEGDSAVVEIGAQKHTLRVGESPTSVGTQGGSTGGTKVVLTAGGGGHFLTMGQINGHATQFVVDTGATFVSMSEQDATLAKVNFRNGQRISMSTANGVVPGWRVKLNTVRVGDVTVYDVDAVVSAGSMPFVLLGNSFLTRFQMTRTNDQMVLEKRY
jgi:aspartyl protease family protein